MAAPSAKFENANNWFRASQDPKKLEEFHAKFEEAVENLRKEGLGKTFPMMIDGEEVTADDTFTSTNPGNTNEVVGTFQKGNAEHVDRAVKAAKKAQPEWEALGWEKRAEIIDRAADIMSERRYHLCAVMSIENGKNRVEAMYDVDEATDFLRYYAQQMRAHKGYVTPMGEPFPGEKCASVMRPWGVFGVIAPFNFPVAIATGMTSGALVTGNAAVLKPASDTPLCGYEVYKLLREAGVPGGVLHYVTGGGREVGQALIDHDDLGGLVFTGSRAVGMLNYGNFVSKSPRPYICEMGGKNACVVTAKADLDKAVPGVLRSAFGFGGQKCSAASRAYVHADVYDEFMRRLADEVKDLVVGPQERRENGYGPLINKAAVDTFTSAVEAAKKAGGEIVSGGNVIKAGDMANGYYVEPTVVTGLPMDHEAFRVEYFVPFVSVAKFTDLDQAINEVNAVDYGLTSGIFTEDPEETRRYFDRVEAGVVYSNRSRGGSSGAMVGGQSFGGWKFSGTTSRGAGGPQYLQQFMREQSRTIDMGDAPDMDPHAGEPGHRALGTSGR